MRRTPVFQCPGLNKLVVYDEYYLMIMPLCIALFRGRELLIEPEREKIYTISMSKQIQAIKINSSMITENK